MENTETKPATPTPTPAPAPSPAVKPPLPAPDAVLFDASWIQGRTHRARIHTVCERLETIFHGAPKPGGAHFRAQSLTLFLGSRDAGPPGVGFSIVHPPEHPLAGEDRFDWVDGPDGCKFGYFKKDQT